jgi:hypothetical protein
MADQERFEYVYKFVSRGRYTPADRAPSMRIFDEGTLYAARFNANGSGEWLELSDGKNGLDGTAGFASQAEVLITARGAADKAGATPMGRPEWITVHPTTKKSFCRLANNSRRGESGMRTPDAANPRAQNVLGHIIAGATRGEIRAPSASTGTSSRWLVIMARQRPAALRHHRDPQGGWGRRWYLKGQVRRRTEDGDGEVTDPSSTRIFPVVRRGSPGVGDQLAT